MKNRMKFSQKGPYDMVFRQKGDVALILNTGLYWCVRKTLERSTSTYQRNPFWFMGRILEDKHIKKFRFSRTPRGAVNGPEKTPLSYLPFLHTSWKIAVK